MTGGSSRTGGITGGVSRAGSGSSGAGMISGSRRVRRGIASGSPSGPVAPVRSTAAVGCLSFIGSLSAKAGVFGKGPFLSTSFLGVGRASVMASGAMGVCKSGGRYSFGGACFAGASLRGPSTRGVSLGGTSTPGARLGGNSTRGASFGGASSGSSVTGTGGIWGPLTGGSKGSRSPGSRSRSRPRGSTGGVFCPGVGCVSSLRAGGAGLSPSMLFILISGMGTLYPDGPTGA